MAPCTHPAFLPNVKKLPLELKKARVFLNPENIQVTHATQNPPCFFYYVFGKGRAAGVQLENHICGMAYSIAQTAIVCFVSPNIYQVSITACP